MEELSKQVKNDLLRMLIWALVSVGIAAAIYYLLW
jgi:hypothetical protein